MPPQGNYEPHYDWAAHKHNKGSRYVRDGNRCGRL